MNVFFRYFPALAGQFRPLPAIARQPATDLQHLDLPMSSPKLVFHALMFARPAGELVTELVPIGDASWPSIRVPEEALHQGWLQTWEDTIDRLSQLPRLYTEPDGSFVWASEGGRLAGVLYDRAGRMCYAELFGDCTPEVLDQFLTACGSPVQRFVFQLPQAGINLAEDDFRAFVTRIA